MARTAPTSFIDDGPKLRVFIIVKWELTETAKNRGEPRKMNHSSETEISIQGGPNGKVVAPSVLMICTVDKSCDSKTKILTFGPKYPNFGSKLHIFVSSGQLEPHRSIFSTQKRCLIGSLI